MIKKNLYVLLLLGILAISCKDDTPSTSYIQNDNNSSSNAILFNLNVKTQPEEGGVVTPSEGEFKEGDEVEITAMSNDGWRFLGWQGDLEGKTNPTLINLDGNKDVTAQFTEREYPLNIEIQGKGAIVEDILEEHSNDDSKIIQLTAGANKGWSFSGWEGDLEGNENPNVLEVNEEKNVRAIFESDKTFWHIPQSEIIDVIGKDGIPSIDNPNFTSAFDTDTYWSQMQLRGIKGEFGGVNIETYQVIETTWETWKKIFPYSKVLNTDTGFSRNYNGYAYGSDYSTTHSQILFPRTNMDDRLENKVRVHGIIDSEVADSHAKVKAYIINRFDNGITLIKDRIGNNDYLIAGSKGLNFATAFKLDEGYGLDLQFSPAQNQMPVIMTDNEGNRWNIFGIAIEGPRKGTRLIPAKSYTGYWFAWADFFPGLDLWPDHTSN